MKQLCPYNRHDIIMFNARTQVTFNSDDLKFIFKKWHYFIDQFVQLRKGKTFEEFFN